eukprot:TRINITY_DN162_c0_g1_i1.p1 TRINITY_DN162_c0_g1~~TRINITY_DN162_c0_g1_i1.p1  ORF type:complete len:321 (+),score=75.51 TRINITY_DN162_c0_g1_i1:180-1142(+)
MNNNNENRVCVLVTGGTGLVGKAIERIVTENGTIEKYFFAGSKDGNLCDIEQTVNLFDKIKPTHVIHLAANVGGLFKNMKYKVEMYQSNMKINDNVLSCCRDFGVKKVVSMLSTCIFPDKIEKYPFNETVIHNGAPHQSNEGYAYAKRMLEVQSRLFNDQYDNCNYTCVIPTNVFGPNDNFNLEDAHVLPALIHKCFLAKKNNTDFTIFGTGKPLRQFIYSLDLARLVLWCLDNYNDSEPLMLCPSDEVSIKYIAEQIANSFDIESGIKLDTTKSDGQYKKTASNAKLLSLLPNFEFTNFEDAIRETVQWFIENFDNCRK